MVRVFVSLSFSLSFKDTSIDFCVVVGRIWAGHNIKRFDCVRIRDAFAEIGLSPPEPKATIDSLSLLSQKFGKRAGDMKVSRFSSSQ